MASWEEVVECKVNTELRPQVLRRSSEMKRVYDVHRLEASRMYSCHGDYIKATYMTNGATTTFTQNKFPYNVAENIHHHTLWSLKPLTERQIKKELKAYLPNVDPKHTVFFVNERRYQSVPELWHCQVFWKLAGDSRTALSSGLATVARRLV